MASPADRKPDEVFVLGTGQSIGLLSDEEREWINRSDFRLAINKFMAFYKLSGIVPTHAYFVDHIEGAAPFLQYIFDRCMEDGLGGLTFILSRKYADRVITVPSVLRAARLVLRALPVGDKTLFRAPAGCRYEFVTREHYLAGCRWAASIKEPLFHFRGSLTSVLNYVAVKCPGRKIKLVGTDFNSPSYFFQEELDNLDLPWQDWTTPIVREKGLHISAIDHKGTTMFDKFDVLMGHLRASGNKLCCCNPDSLLVTKGLVEYAPVLG